MATTAYLNIRLPKELKDQGNQVLERSGVSVSKLVRSMYEYMAREQEIPSFAVQPDAGDAVQCKRRVLRSLAGIADIPADLDARQVWRDHLVEKHGSATGDGR